MAQKKVIEIELKEISVSLEGVRTDNWTVNQSIDWDREQCGFKELVTSIEHLGQLEAGIVRENRSDTRHQWELVVGFRRFAALRCLWERNNDRRKFRAIVEDWDDKQALEAMIATNMRVPLDVADLAFAIDKYSKTLNEKEPGYDDRVSDKLGINKGLTFSLMRLVRNAPTIAKHWQHDTARMSLSDMLQLANLKTEDAQREAYEKAMHFQALPDETQEESRLREIADDLRRLADKLESE